MKIKLIKSDEMGLKEIGVAGDILKALSADLKSSKFREEFDMQTYLHIGFNSEIGKVYLANEKGCTAIMMGEQLTLLEERENIKFKRGWPIIHVNTGYEYVVLEEPVIARKLENYDEEYYVYQETCLDSLHPKQNIEWVRRKSEMEDGRFILKENYKKP